MNIVRYEPWTLLNEFRNQINNMWEQAPTAENGDHSNVVTSQWRPAVDIKEEDDRFLLRADIPGVHPKDIEITMDKGILSVKGERALDTEENRQGYSRVERAYGVFYRRFSLPDSADPEGIQAKGENGVLVIVIPKKPVAQPRKIEVTP